MTKTSRGPVEPRVMLKLLAIATASSCVAVLGCGGGARSVVDGSTQTPPASSGSLAASPLPASSDVSIAVVAAAPAPSSAAAVSPPSPPQTLAAGAHFTCTLRAGNGQVACWGSNDAGQLGAGHRSMRHGAVAVEDVIGAVEVAAGGASACARNTLGDVWCWGRLGAADGAVRTIANTHADQIAVGGQSACAVRNGKLHCWNDVGDVTVAGLPTSAEGAVVQVALANNRGCVRLTNGNVWCWQDAALSDGERELQTKRVESLGDVVELDMFADETCARRALPDDGGHIVLCWPSYSDPKPPIDDPLLRVTSVHLGKDWGCVRDRWEFHCWGGGPHDAGEEYLAVDELEVTRLSAVVNPTAVAAGEDHLCARLVTGEVMCLGDNSRAQLGVRSGLVQTRPRRQTSLQGIKQLMSGADHLCAGDGKQVTCWGKASHGQLGASYARSPHVWENSELSLVNTVSSHTCALAAGGHVACWGLSNWGQVGEGPPLVKSNKANQFTSVLGFDNEAFVSRVNDMRGAMAVATAGDASCALNKQGAWCWGRSGLTEEEARSDDAACVQRSSLLGDSFGRKPRDAGDCGALKTPTLVPATVGAQALVSVEAGFCILQQDAIRCWDRAQLAAHLPPRVLANLDGPKQLFGGPTKGCAIDKHNVLKCWTLASMFARAVVGLTASLAGATVKQMHGGARHQCVVDNQDGVHCWGSNTSGQLGHEVRSTQLEAPERVVNLPPTRSVALGASHSCALTLTGEVWCWGGPSTVVGTGLPLVHSSQPLAVEGLR